MREASDKPIDINRMPTMLNGPPMVPYFFEKILNAIEKRIETRDIHLRDGVKSEVQKLYDEVAENEYNFDATTDPHTLATLLRKVIRNLKQPLIDEKVFDQLKVAIETLDESKKAIQIRDALLGLGITRFNTLNVLFGHLNRVASLVRDDNTSLASMCVLFSATLFNYELAKLKKQDDVKLSQKLTNKIIEFIIKNHNQIFNKSSGRVV